MEKKFVSAFKTLLMVLVGVLVISVIGLTVSYLSDLIDDTGTGTIGSVALEVRDGETLLNGYDDGGTYINGIPLEITTGAIGEDYSLNFTIKNTGTINGLVRVFVSILYEPAEDFPPEPVKQSEILLTTTGWENVFADDGVLEDNNLVYYSYFNDVLAGNQTINIIQTLRPLTEVAANKNITILFEADIVAHSGNAYLTGGTIKPFGDLSADFLEIWTAWEEN